ncbi:MAG: leucine-rich repeat domain-containing protein [Faecalibacterium sp.]
MMKNITRRTFLAALGVTTATLLVGCGDSTDSTSIVTSSTTNSSASTTSGDTVEEDTTVTASSGTLTEEIIRAYPETDESYFKTSPVEGGVSITGCTSTDDVIVIPETIGGETVVMVGKSSFYGAEYKGIVLPDTVVEIEDYAFMNTESLEAIWLGIGLVEVGTCAFVGCSSLKTITFPEGTTTFSLSIMMAYSPELETVYIPESLETFGPPFEPDSCPNAVVVTPAGSAMEAYAIEQEIPYETY